MRNLLCSVLQLIFLGCLLPAQADDVWEVEDAISKTVKRQLAEERGETPASSDTEQAAADDTAESEAQVPTPASPPPLRDSGRSDETTPASTQRSGSGNVLGPLWGVPAEAPVMQMIDPARELEYARDSQGRLVPRTQLTPEEEKAQRERDKQREREQREAEKRAAAEQRRAKKEAEAAQREQEREQRLAREREERAAREASGQSDADSQSETEPEVPKKDSDQAQADDGKDSEEFRDHKMGGRSTPQDEGW